MAELGSVVVTESFSIERLEDQRLEAEPLADPKERAEHLMLPAKASSATARSRTRASEHPG